MSLGLLLFRLLMLLGVLAMLALFAAQQLTALMGATPIEDGYQQLVERAPPWANRVFAAPWWAPVAAAAVPILLLVWPARARRAPPVEQASAQVEEAGQAEPIVFERVREATGPYLENQHVYAGSAKLSMVPEFRAVPVRPITHATIFIEYSFYATESHRWMPRRRILIAEIHHQDADEWSVINVELMTSYLDESGGRVWRWAREFDSGPPSDEEYRFTVENHYQGRVVFEGPEDSVHHSYFSIMPSNDRPSDMPNLISQDIFDFVADWEAQDREEVLTI